MTLSILREAKDWGLKRRGEIASVYAESLGLPPSFLEDYLVRNIDYDLGQEHIAGLEKYYRLAMQEGLIPELRPLRFLDGG